MATIKVKIAQGGDIHDVIHSDLKKCNIDELYIFQ